MGVVELSSTLEDNNLEVTTSILQDTGSDLESMAKECQDILPSTRENVQKSPKGRNGRERRKPQRYSE